jgi:hypothetical protein
MGASGWEYVVPYQPDLGAALDALRHQVFVSGEYLKPSFYGEVFDLPEPASVEDLLEQEQYQEFMGTSGTHSIIDVQAVVPADAGDEFGAIRPLSDAECAELFGDAQPSRADYESLANSERLYDHVTGGRWTGRAAVLWADDSPSEIVFWGISGDLPSVRSSRIVASLDRSPNRRPGKRSLAQDIGELAPGPLLTARLYWCLQRAAGLPVYLRRQRQYLHVPGG